MSLRIPSPKALTKPEAYLAYKAGIMSRDELKQSVYNPLNNYEGWLAKWCGLLETYPTNEDGTPQCLTDEEGLLAYLCGVTNRYPATNSRPDDARISAYIRYLVSARYIRPDHPLNREEFYLSLIKTQFIPSGDPSSDIVIDGTTKAPFVDVKLYGDTAQNSYTGKNLLQLASSSDTGLTGIVNADGSLTIRGTAEASRGLKVFTTTRQFPAGTYTFSISSALSSVINLTLASNVGFRIPAGETSITTTLEQNYGGGSLFFAATSGREYDFTIKAQLVSGSTPDYDFEPYVGEMPSPSPDYPQPIRTVTGAQTVEVVGKNLFNKNTSTLGVLNGDGTIGFSNDYSTSDFIQVTPDTTYHKTQTTSARFKFYNINKTPVSSVYDDIPSAGDAQSFTTPSSCYYIRFSFRNNTKDSIQIEKGSTATAYAPYSKQTYPIDLGNIELNNLDDTYADYIWEDRDEWKIHKATRSAVFDGSEVWSKSGNSNNTSFYYASNQNPNFKLDGIDDASIQPSVSKAIALADNFSDVTGNVANVDRIGFSIDKTSTARELRIGMGKSSTVSTAALFKTWLEDNNITLCFALATPTDTVITNQALIDQLNALKQGGAEEGTTYIKVSATDPNLPAKLYVEAPKYD